MTAVIVLLVLLIIIGVPVVAVILIVKLVSYSGRLNKLEKEVSELKNSLKVPPQKDEIPKAEKPLAKYTPAELPPNLLGVTPPPPPAPKPKEEIPVPASAPAKQEIIEPEAKPVASVIPAEPPQPQEPPRKSRTSAEWEALIGGKWLNRIGAIALIIGMGFFLKYSMDKNWITPVLRVLIGVFIGAGLTGIGMYYHKKGFKIFSQGLLGTGISVLYMTIFFAFKFYNLLPQIPAFGIMALVTAIAFILATRYNSLAIALLSWAGGFLTPILLSTGQANEVGLFSYIALLDLGILAMTVKKDKWVILEPLTLAATYIMYFAWYGNYYKTDDLGITILFASIFWGLFYALDILRIIKSRLTYPGTRQTVASLNAIIYYIAMYIMVNPEHHKWMGLATLIIGLVYLITILIVKRRLVNDRMVMPRYVLTAIALLVIATSIQFTGFKTVTFWAIEAFLLIWCAVRWQLKYVWITALGLFAVAILKLLFTEGAFAYEPFDKFHLIRNNRMMAFSAVAAMLGLSAWLLNRLTDAAGAIIRSILHYTWIAIVFILFTVETRDCFQQLLAGKKDTVYLKFIGALAFPMVWMLYSLPLVWLGLKKNISAWLNCGYAILLLAVFAGCIRGFVFEPLSQFTLLFNIRAGVLALLLVVLVVHIRLFTRQENRYSVASQILYYAWCLALFVLCTFEVNDYFRKELSGRYDKYLDFFRYMAFPAVWVFYSLLTVWGGLRRYTRPLIYSGLAVLSLAFFWGVLQGLSFAPLDRFSLLINIRAMVLAFMLIGIGLEVWMFRRSSRSHDWHNNAYYWLCLAWSVALFVLCTTESNDYFRSILAAAGSADYRYYSFARYLVLPVVWVAYSLPLAWWGLKKGVRTVAYPAFSALLLAILFTVFCGFTFSPIDRFVPVLNLRALALAAAVIGAIIHLVLLNRRRSDYPWAGQAVRIFQVVVVLMIWELLTVEAKDLFSRLMSDVAGRKEIDSASEIGRLRDLRQLALSGVWLVYSIILMGAGIWKRKRWLRIMSIILFGITILKIFIFDLSFLDTLYRIFSFMGLGVILLIVSYLYHRFKSVIFDSGMKKE